MNKLLNLAASISILVIGFFVLLFIAIATAVLLSFFTSDVIAFSGFLAVLVAGIIFFALSYYKSHKKLKNH
ncbi:hypothetical protein [Campylobacter iguaniorum]|uniref:hypothetical protein n=1 Tax=Campylobacter iguaniorum TaxID=1244531 RepID=UPI00073A28F0|nr:hypothetical protein [Campylobacter iguaniorum]